MACTISTRCSANSSAELPVLPNVPLALRLRVRRSGRRGWRRRGRFVEVEIDLGGLPRSLFRLEIRVVACESGESGNQAVREERDVGVVILHRFVVAAT